MTGRLALLNGRLVLESELVLSYADAGFVFGATVTDTCRTYSGRLFRFGRHLARFRHDCDWLGVALAHSDAELTAFALELVARNAVPGGETAVVTFATPGPVGPRLGRAGSGPPTVAMHTTPVDPARYPWADAGATLRVVGTWPTGELWPGAVKHRSRVGWYQASRHPALLHGELATLLTESGLADTPVASVLGYEAGTLIAPVAGTVLESVTVEILKDVCRLAGVRFTRAPLRVDDWLAGPGDRELLLAGTGFGVAPVARWVGPRRTVSLPHRDGFRRLRSAWGTLVERESGGLLDA